MKGNIMSKHDAEAVHAAIKEAVENAIAIFGIESVRKLSMFPSAEYQAVEYKEAA